MPVEFGGHSVITLNLVSPTTGDKHRSRYENIDILTSLVCAHYSKSRLVSSYWRILGAMQTTAASKSVTVCLLERLVPKSEKTIGVKIT